MRLVYSKLAAATLDELIDYIAVDNPMAAIEVRDAIEVAANRLVEHPKLGHVGRVRGTREWVVPRLPYVVIYRLRAEIVEVVQVLHTARQWPI